MVSFGYTRYDNEDSVALFRYDALGRRVSKIVTGGSGDNGETVFVSSIMPLAHSPHAGQELAEYTINAEAASPIRKYVYADYIDEPVMMVNVSGENETKYYYHANNIYSVAALTKQNGSVQIRYAYDAYGRITWIGTDVGNRYFFTGRRYDVCNGIYYYRARYYHPTLGRFLGRDPIGYEAHCTNLYEYVDDNPLIHIDPSGLRNPAKPFEYVPNAVEFRGGRKPRWTPNNPEAPGQLTSHFEIQARPLPKMFPKCACERLCNKVGFVQIERAGLDAFGFLLGGIQSYLNTHDWRVDGKIPYPYGDVSDPSKGEWMNFSDFPGGINGQNIGWTVEILAQDFEVHVMCLAGKEKGAVYGGFEWGHSFRRRGQIKIYPAPYMYYSYSKKITTPSKAFKTVVTAYYQGSL